MKNAIFPTQEWILATKEKFNTDEQYAQIAKNWEADVRLILEPEGALTETTWLYWDLWHGTCREAMIEDQSSNRTPALIVTAPYGKFIKVLSGEVKVIQALLSRMIHLQGSMSLIMRNVPTVIDFVRCCQEVTEGWI